MSLTVLNVAYPLAPVGPDAVGGAEQVLSAIDEALQRAGHRSIVLACEGSRAAGELIPTPLPRGPLDQAARERAWSSHRAAIRAVLDREHVDVVHLHGVDFHRYLPPPGPPTLATLHLPPAWYPGHVFRLDRPLTHLHCVSRTQRLSCPPGARLLDDIPNGVSLERLHPAERKEGFALVLGRLCPEKGVHLALRAARRAGIPLCIAGAVFPYPEHERYFREEIAPLLTAEHRFIGAVGMERKVDLLARAACLLVPSLVPETSSLVAMEALACGTPVIAFRAGALPELVEHGRTGFLVDTEEALAAALPRATEIDPRACRAAAEARPSLEVMCDRYLETYRRLARGRPAARRATPAAARWEVIRSFGALQEMSDEWIGLWERCPGATVFQHPDWLLPWCEHLFSGELLALSLRTGGGRLAGLAPLHRWADGGRRVLSMLGSGHSDYQELLLEPALAEEGSRALGAWLVAHGAEWDRIEISELRASSALLSLPLPEGASASVEEHDACPVLSLPAGASALREVVPRRTAANLRSSRHRAEQLGRLSFESACAGNLDELLDALFRLHASRWRGQGGGVLAPAAVQRFHRDVARRFLGRGMLVLDALRIGREIASVVYAFDDREALLFYLSGFEPAYARASAGSLVVAHVLERALRRGAARADFLRGREPYKYAWGAVDTPIFRWRLHRPRGVPMHGEGGQSHA
jgi:CelD/BcsL family acetyltransferase involved in cellulose biosynthesis